QNLQQDSEVQVPDAKARKQDGAGAIERLDEVVGERRILGDDGDQEVEKIVLAQGEGSWVLRAPEEVVDERRVEGCTREQLRGGAHVRAEVIAEDKRALALAAQRLCKHFVVGGREDQIEGKPREQVVRRRRPLPT